MTAPNPLSIWIIRPAPGAPSTSLETDRAYTFGSPIAGQLTYSGLPSPSRSARPDVVFEMAPRQFSWVTANENGDVTATGAVKPAPVPMNTSHGFWFLPLRVT